ncbi:MAG: hypothetical protein HQ592_15645, partial [Planctomycetes bacterium]|nr:hypothetical protein [Planctomycetota bacterium]
GLTTLWPRLILEGPPERGELAHPSIGGEVTIDIYGQDLPGFAGFQIELHFLPLAQAAPTFVIALNDPPVGGPWDDRKVVHNDTFLPNIDTISNGQIVGLTSLDADNSIGGKTLLMSITYEYTRDAAAVAWYTIDANRETTAADDRDENPLPFEVITGGLNIGWPIRGDADGNCIVNVLDMLTVRNAFLKNIYSADNWQADVNNDGTVDVLDMLEVHIALKDACP